IATSRDIYNVRRKLYDEYQQERMSIQALLDNLKKGLFKYDYN
ncbi:2534_t:CDS:1, partial [Racocetra fulgida]